jgi:hypothetical protein
MMMMSIQEEMKKAEEHVLNFKGSIKGMRVIPRDRISGARLLYTDYFTADNIPSRFHSTPLLNEQKFVPLWRRLMTTSS